MADFPCLIEVLVRRRFAAPATYVLMGRPRIIRSAACNADLEKLARRRVASRISAVHRLF